MKSIILISCCIVAAALINSASSDCQADFTACQTSYNTSMASAAGDKAKICVASNNLITCCRDLKLRADCASISSALDEARRKAEEKLTQQAPDCAHCSMETDKCNSTYHTSQSAAGANVTALCNAGQNYVLCLRKTDQKPECTAEKKTIEKERIADQKKLQTSGCDTGAQCLTAVDKCQATYKQGKAGATSEKQRCQVGLNYENCLKASDKQGVCMGLFAEELKIAMADIAEQERKGNCDSVLGAASSLRPASLALATVAMVILAFIR